MKNIKLLENYERIVSIYKKIFEKYKVGYIYEYIDFQKYNVYISDTINEYKT